MHLMYAIKYTGHSFPWVFRQSYNNCIEFLMTLVITPRLQICSWHFVKSWTCLWCAFQQKRMRHIVAVSYHFTPFFEGMWVCVLSPVGFGVLFSKNESDISSRSVISGHFGYTYFRQCLTALLESGARREAFDNGIGNRSYRMLSSKKMTPDMTLRLKIVIFRM